MREKGKRVLIQTHTQRREQKIPFKPKLPKQLEPKWLRSIVGFDLFGLRASPGKSAMGDLWR